ncbi:hypothetical protein LZ009_05045 [Ramlibacter sp. XY19]|uniref:hypothetical protein n=1 Tax=Ramlibacter paludis TaxID=2908000 RepID=UPI0023DC7812|nr:hypothetical protein [Ramlibacter paludis]MCG2592142.1 hypothetical protein [Ramlibacter paludis]
MEFTEGHAETPVRYSVEAVARFVEWVAQYHPDGERWADLAAIVRTHPDRFIYASPSARIVDLASAAGDASR